jgi:hypothetical protein
MRPAFKTLTIGNNGASVTVNGPIDLDGSETDAYFWVRVTQRGGVEGIGCSDKDRDWLKAEYKAANNRLLEALRQASAPATLLKLGDLTTAVKDQSAMWDTRVKASSGVFVPGIARVEAWALVRARNPTREFHVYWVENRVDVVEDEG